MLNVHSMYRNFCFNINRTSRFILALGCLLLIITFVLLILTPISFVSQTAAMRSISQLPRAVCKQNAVICILKIICIYAVHYNCRFDVIEKFSQHFVWVLLNWRGDNKHDGLLSVCFHCNNAILICIKMCYCFKILNALSRWFKNIIQLSMCCWLYRVLFKVKERATGIDVNKSSRLYGILRAE